MTREKTSAAIGLALLALATPGFGASSPPAAEPVAPAADVAGALDALFRGAVTSHDFSGVAFVAVGDRIVFEAAYGLADRTFGVPNAIDARFPIASISKTFVAAVVLRLAARGQIDLAAPVSRYLPELPARLGDRITVHQLLAHTSGLPREIAFEPWESLDLAEQVRRLGKVELLAAPGAGYAYSNAAYVLLGRLAEVVAGRPYERLLADEVLGPLGLTDTGLFVGRRIVERAATGYRLGRAGLEIAPRARHLGIYPPGAMYSTVRDLHRFVRALEGGGLLPERLVRESFREHARESAESTTGSGYAWEIKHRGERTYVSAAGSGDGGKSVLLHEPASKTTVILLTNRAEVPIGDLVANVVRILAGREPVPPAPCRIADLARYAGMLGDYDFTATALARQMDAARLVLGLVRDGDRLFLWGGAEESADLVCEREPGTLVLSFSDEMRIRFEPGVAGEPPAMVVDWDGRTYRAPRLP